MAKIIIVNSGSASAKYALFDNQDQIAFYHYEKEDKGNKLIQKIGESISRTINININDYEKSFNHFINSLLDHKLILNYSDIAAVVFRVVAPGIYFQEDRIINSVFMQKIIDLKRKSPIHLSHLHKEIEAVKNVLKDIKMIAISDSAYHKNKPIYNSIYALPKDFMEKHELYRFGYHGISVESVLDKVKQKMSLPKKIIVCHLGGGSSVTAIKEGVSIDNSMGYSPVSGILMATRVGDIDTEAFLSVLENEKISNDDLHTLIYKKSGLLGISNLSDDVRVVVDNYDTNADARNAIDYYVSSVRKYIGSYFAELNGLDLLVFTGTIGLRSYKMRERICKELDALGIRIDSNLNLKADECEFINSHESSVLITYIETDEMKMMAKKAIKFFDEIGL